MPEPNRQPCAYHILRYTPNLVRDEWVNIGVLLFDPAGGARRLRLIEEQEEYARVKRLHPHADEALLRALRDDFEKQFAGQNGGFRKAVETLNQTLSNALQLGPQKGVLTDDLDAEIERLYADHVAPPSRLRSSSARETLFSRGPIRNYCNQVRQDFCLRRVARHREGVHEAARPGASKNPGVHRGAHPRENSLLGIHRRYRCPSGRHKRPPPLRRRNTEGPGNRGGASGVAGGLGEQIEAVNSLRDSGRGSRGWPVTRAKRPGNYRPLHGSPITGHKLRCYKTGSLQPSSVSFTLRMNWWAIAPSTTR